MEEILHQLIRSLSHDLRILHIPRGAGFLPSTFWHHAAAPPGPMALAGPYWHLKKPPHIETIERKVRYQDFLNGSGAPSKKIKHFAKTYRFGASIFCGVCVCVVCPKRYNLSGEDLWRSGIVNTQYGKVLVDGASIRSTTKKKLGLPEV